MTKKMTKKEMFAMVIAVVNGLEVENKAEMPPEYIKNKILINFGGKNYGTKQIRWRLSRNRYSPHC